MADKPNGVWLYGALVSEPGEPQEVYASYSLYSHEPFYSAEEVRELWPDYPVVRQWRSYVAAWEPVPE